MKATYEIRVPEEYADLLFSSDEGVRLGDTVRKILLPGDDPRLSQVGELDNEISTHAKEPPRYFFSYCTIHYRYSKEELAQARLFHIRQISTFEPPGEMCGTEYDESTACPQCGAGATQTSELRLDLRKAPKSKDIAQTIAGEIIVSQRLAELLIDRKLTGFELHPVRHKARYEDDPVDFTKVPSGREILRRAEAAGLSHPAWPFWVWLNRPENDELCQRARQEHAERKGWAAARRGKPLPVWHQLVVTARADVAAPTRVGINPFDEDEEGKCRCPLGDLIGLNLLSEVSIAAAARDEADFIGTRQFIGTRRGVLQPERILLVSPRVRQLIESEQVKGLKLDVAYLV